jgi:hypothetical protein
MKEMRKAHEFSKGEKSDMTKDSSMASFTRNMNFNPSNATLALTQLTGNPSMKNINSPHSMAQTMGSKKHTRANAGHSQTM